MTNFIAARSREAFQQHMDHLRRTGVRQACEFELIGNKPRYVQMESVATNSTHIRMSMIDVTTRKQTEIELMKANKSLDIINNLFQSADDAMAAIDASFTFLTINNAFSRTFKKVFNIEITPGMCLVKSLSHFPQVFAHLLRVCNDSMHGKADSYQVENHHTNASSEYFCYEMRFTPLFDAQQERRGSIFTMVDVTQRKLNERKQFRRQAELAHVGRITAMGEMASALAHQINQPLAVIGAYSQGCLCMREKISASNLSNKDKATFTTAIAQLATQVEYAGEIAHRMKNFMRDGIIYPEQVNINDVINEALFFLNYELLEFCPHIILGLKEDLPVLYIDRVQMSQVILNIVRNSIEALQQSTITKPEIRISTLLRSNCIEVNIVDNGPGIPDDIRDKILKSYFTTKPQGTGLGLPICRTLIEAHGGKLEVLCPQTTGAWIQFTLPTRTNDTYE